LAISVVLIWLNKKDKRLRKTEAAVKSYYIGREGEGRLRKKEWWGGERRRKEEEGRGGGERRRGEERRGEQMKFMLENE
jgi:hypothetical protein